MSVLADNLSRRQFAPHSFCIMARVVFEEGKVGVGGLGKGESWGCIAKLAASKKQPGACLQLCVRGKKQVGLLSFCWLPFWHSWASGRKPGPGGLKAAG